MVHLEYWLCSLMYVLFQNNLWGPFDLKQYFMPWSISNLIALPARLKFNWCTISGVNHMLKYSLQDVVGRAGEKYHNVKDFCSVWYWCTFPTILNSFRHSFNTCFVLFLSSIITLRKKVNLRSFPIQAFHKEPELVLIEKWVVNLSDRSDGRTKRCGIFLFKEEEAVCDRGSSISWRSSGLEILKGSYTK